MSSVGHLIKLERVAKKIKQTSLAKGICSPSYLSKIENNLIVPSDEVIRLILKRLDIELKEIPNKEEDQIVLSLSEMYKKSIIKRERQDIIEYLKSLWSNSINFMKLSNYYDYLLYSFRLLMISGKEKRYSDKFYQLLKNLEVHFNEKQTFLYNLNSGLYHHLENNNENALFHLERSLDFINKIPLEEFEKADFHNVISLSYLKNMDYSNAILFSSKALEFYKDNLLFERSIDCYLTIGIAQKNLINYKNAEENYNLALKLANDLNLEYYKSIILHNLGFLYASQDIHEKAIIYYKKSLEIKDMCGYMEGAIITILSIVKEYSKQNNSIQVQQWCKEGLKRIIHSEDQFYKSYHFHFLIYRYLYNITPEFESILKKAIKYFEEINDDRHTQKYSILLADYYFKVNKFKAAGLFYKKSNNVLLRQKKIKSWEDL
ncbi:helix-turn-helix domain-containing protein [Psychrobacillus vulpis]|uniref:Helix-turn-helix domain-containing protein n=1 Tax=Psychrobacillus vulpis TaxID=2325572 RepID=A0A544TIQ5_9BACI|nr:helix-turn-helix domain-containing protein [Psychrobacillus vulpis]TQR17326.1 helix-turn-helix domain-containing protein [Psychrobacillus vulpis]